MAIVEDPEGRENSVLHEMVDFRGARVLEVGCGEGRLTWHYADKAASIMAIDPDGQDIEKAQANTPEELKGRVQFQVSSIEDFADSSAQGHFDIAIFAWSL